MIADWRTLWGDPKLPFLFVQLAGFADGKEYTQGTDWARLREAQRRTAEHVERTAMVQAYDLGEYNDLHPTDKKSVGKRIALTAENLIYGKNVVCQGAGVKEVNRRKETVQVTFGPDETVLHVVEKEGKKQVCGFSWIKEDASRVAAEAKLTGRSAAELKIPKETQYIGISYAWNDCPLDANLYNEAGLPVVPFEIIF